MLFAFVCCRFQRDRHHRKTNGSTVLLGIHFLFLSKIDFLSAHNNTKVKINTPKTKSSIRTIRLCDECIRLLSELKANQVPKSKYIFPSSVTGEIRDTSAVTRRLHRIQDRAGVPRIRFHDLRHSFATLSLEQGMDIETVSHMLGHTDAGFTMNTYMHVTDSMQENVANTMGNLLGGNAANS